MPELLQDWVSRNARDFPDSVAIVSGDERLSYAELDELSTRLARLLHENGCYRSETICLLMPKSPLAIVAILAIYKADAIYVPLDPASPVARLEKIIESCESRWILAAGDVAPQLVELRKKHPLSIGWLEETGSKELDPAFLLGDVRAAPPEIFDYVNRSDDPAHILFTSGSTGTPKGVVITHANVIAFIEWARKHFRINRSDRLSAHPPLHFDLSVFDLFGSFSAGAELHIVPSECNLLPNKLATWMRESRITQWFSVPSVLKYMASFDVIEFGDFPDLKRLLWCGEVLPTPVLRHWMKRLRHVSFTNLYGPTETTIASSYYTVPACPSTDTEPLPIGSACDGEELLVLDDSLQPVAAGDTGHIYIGGVGLSPGYWRNPEQTRTAFIEVRDVSGNPRRLYRTGDIGRLGHDGQVYFLGREDAQIKSRGYRIELGEIEAALHAVKGVRECAVVAIPSSGFEGAAIACAYVPSGRKVTPAYLRDELAGQLPHYMIPVEWMSLQELPKNGSGKIDRRKLKEVMTGNGLGAA